MAATITYANILKYGLQAQYDALVTAGTVDASVLYFCTDTKKIYKGTIDFTDSVVVASEKPATPIVGKIYVLADTGTVEVYTGTAWQVVSYPVTTTIADSATGNDDVHVPTAKAVYDFVEAEIAEAIGGEGVIAKVEVSTTEGKIKVTDGKGTATDVAVHGVVTTPTYDATSRKFTFPVVDGDDVVVELGTDIFIDPNANNRYESGYLYLYLNDAKGEKAATELKIPVSALVTDYFGEDTTSIQVNIDKDTHKVTAAAILRPDSTETGAEFTNALKVGDTGLYVDLSAVIADIASVSAAASTANSYAAVNSAAASTAQSSANVANSYAAANSAAISALAVSADSYADANSAAISAEVVRATSYEDANSAAISSISATAVSGIEAISEAASTANSYAAVNSAALSGEIARATSYEDANSAAISGEVARATSYDAATSAALSSEIARATSYDAANSAAASTADANATSLHNVDSAAISALAVSADSYADANSAAASAADSHATVNTDNLAALAVAVGWGTF